MELVQQALKDKVMSKVEEMIQCAMNIGRFDCFEINIKHIDGELISSMKFCSDIKASEGSKAVS